MTLLLLAIAISAFAEDGPVKQRRTLWSDDEIQRARTAAPGEVNPGIYADLTLEQLWELMPPTTIPREHTVDQTNRCPIDGLLPGFRAWKRDYINRPYQLQCPTCNNWFPNEQYPDDGSGYRDAEGRVYHFIRFYVLWCYLDAVCDAALPQLSQAYALTGDRRYARSAAALLTRVAQQMPNATDKADRCYKGRYGRHAGLITDYVWESIRLSTHAEAYELVFDAIDDDAELVAFVQTKIPQLDSGAKIRRYIEDELLRAGAQALIDETLNGNPGFPQYAKINIAAVLDDYGDRRPNTPDILERLYDGWTDLRFIFSNFIMPDGGGMESLTYNRIQLELLLTLDRFDRYQAMAGDRLPESRYPNLVRHHRVAALLDFQFDTFMHGAFLPGIGDGGGRLTGAHVEPNWQVVWHPRHLLALQRVFERRPEPRMARVLLAAIDDQKWQDPLRPPGREALEAAAAEAPPEAPTRTLLMDHYGIAALHSGEGRRQRTLWMYFGEGRVHHHNDPLNIGLFAFRRDLLPELGYPLQLAMPYRAWEHHLWGHNTAIVDGQYPVAPDNWGITHTPMAVIERMHQWKVPAVQVISARVPMENMTQPPGQPRIDRYQRTLALVDVGDDAFYALDVFHLDGGREHELAFHFPVGAVTTEGVALAPQQGTLAGPEVAYAGARLDDFMPGFIDPRSCMENVRRGAATGPVDTRWISLDEPRTALRLLHLPQEGTELVLADGRPPANPKRYEMTFQFARREGASPLSSRFVTAIEAFTDQPTIQRADRLAVEGDGVAVRVITSAGEDLFIFGEGSPVHVPEAGISTDAFFAVVRRREGGVELLMSQGTSLRAGEHELASPLSLHTVVIGALDYDANTITVNLPDRIDLTGQWVRVGDRARPGTYRVLSQTGSPVGAVLTLDVSSLRGEGRVRGVDKGTIFNDIQMPLGGLMGDKVVSRLLEGTWAINRDTGKAFLVRNVDYGNYYQKRRDWNVQLAQQVTVAALKRAMPDGSIFEIRDYAVGDRVTVPVQAQATFPSR